MHLYPLWSKSVTYSLNITVSSSNAKVESYFKTLKKGTACKQKRMRPRQLLCNELERINGAFNEKKLPSKSGASVNKEKTLLEDEEEKWKPRKRSGNYSSYSTRKRILSGKKAEVVKASENDLSDAADTEEVIKKDDIVTVSVSNAVKPQNQTTDDHEHTLAWYILNAQK